MTAAGSAAMAQVKTPTDGSNGTNGWTPTLVGVADGTRTLIKVADWTGGTGTKPTVGLYIGTAGYVAAKADAFNFNAAKRVAVSTAVSAPVTGIATIVFSPAFPAAPIAVPWAVPNVLSGPVKAEIVAGSLTATGCQVRVTAAALVTGALSALAGAAVTVLAVES